MSTITIAPSILSANFACLGEEVRAVLNAGADKIHVDVMDYHYVPNLTFGPLVCKALRNFGIEAPLDVHLMVKPVDALINDFADAGATAITIHPEATEHLDRSLQLIKDRGLQAGVALNPATPLTYLKYVLDKIDLVLVMTVNPGFGGQQFISDQLVKIQELAAMKKVHQHHLSIQVDGGVTVDNIANIFKASADSFAAGSAIFGSDDYHATIDAMRKACC